MKFTQGKVWWKNVVRKNKTENLHRKKTGYSFVTVYNYAVSQLIKELSYPNGGGDSASQPTLG